MAKQQKQKQGELPTKEKEQKKYPSKYGSHKSMVSKKLTEALNKQGWVVCEDEHGPYETKVSHLDNNLADPFRFNSKRMEDRVEPKQG